MRLGELLALRWESIDFDRKLLTVEGARAKSRQTRHVFLNEEAMSVLNRWREQPLDTQRVFPMSSGFRTAWYSVLRRAKIVRFRWHDLRHHFASSLVQIGVLEKAGVGIFPFDIMLKSDMKRLPIEHFKIKTGAPATPIPYRSSNESITSLMSGQTAFGFIETPAVVPQIAAGNLRALAVTIPTRISELPEVPTLAEAGVSDVVAGTWFGLLAPAGTPMPIVKKIEAASRKIAGTDDFKARMKALSSASIGSTSDELGARMAEEVKRWSAVVKTANIKFEQ